MESDLSVKSRRTPLGELLVEMGLVDEDGLTAALEYKRQHKIKLGQALVNLRLVSEEDLAKALRRQGRIPCITLTPGIVDRAVAESLGEERSRSVNAVAINRIAGVTTVAMADPGDVYGVDEIALQLKAPM